MSTEKHPEHKRRELLLCDRILQGSVKDIIVYLYNERLAYILGQTTEFGDRCISFILDAASPQNYFDIISIKWDCVWPRRIELSAQNPFRDRDFKYIELIIFRKDVYRYFIRHGLQGTEAWRMSEDNWIIRNAISLGGDTDTLGAIAGGIAEAYYGVPEILKKECRYRIPDGILRTVELFYHEINYGGQSDVS